MRDIKGFCKLFDVNIPNMEYFDYYIEQLSKTNKLNNIYDLITQYKEFDKNCDDVFKYKNEKSSEVVQYILNSYAYQEFTCHPLTDYPTNKSFVYEDDKLYVSIDIIKANFTAFKEFDDKNELGNSYEELLQKFDIDPVFSHSKSFRQYIFGNTNPKRQGKVQRVIIERLLNKMPDDLVLETVRADELIYSINDFSELENILSYVNQEIFKVKVFKVKRISDFRVNTYFTFDGEELTSELIGCDGNKYFMLLKEHILKEKLDVRDLYFRYTNGSTAFWNVEGLEIKLK